MPGITNSGCLLPSTLTLVNVSLLVDPSRQRKQIAGLPCPGHVAVETL